MAKGITIGVASDTRDFATGVKRGVVEPLEDASDILKDVARDGDKAGEKLERAMKDAQRETEDMSDEFDQLGRKIRDSSRKASRDIKEGYDKPMNLAGEGVEGFKQEATQNFSEVASSFDGSVDGILDGVQGLTGGLASSLGPAGIVVAAAGAGAAALFNQWKEQTEKIQARVSEMYQDMIESGNNYVSQSFVADKVKEIIDTEEDWAEANKIANETGLDLGTTLRAMAGDSEAVRDAMAKQTEISDEMQSITSKAASEGRDLTKAEQDRIGTLADLTNLIQEMTSSSASASEKARGYAAAMGDMAKQSQDAEDKIADVKQAIVTLPNGKKVTVEAVAETSGAAAALAAFRREQSRYTIPVHVGVVTPRGGPKKW